MKSENDRTYIVTETCPHCENEIVMRWDTDKQGFKAFCPVCGKRLMLCDECMHKTGECINDCDYNSITDTCKFNKPQEVGSREKKIWARIGMSLTVSDEEYNILKELAEEWKTYADDNLDVSYSDLELCDAMVKQFIERGVPEGDSYIPAVIFEAIEIENMSRERNDENG